jgi:integrase
MLYETAARSAEVLALDVEDLDLPNRRAKDHNDQMVMMIKSAAEAAPGLPAPARITTPTGCG